MKNVPQIRRYMTAVPVTVDGKASVRDARDLMEKNGIRHLPVVLEGKVVGIVSSRDLDLAKACEDKIGPLYVHEVKNSHVFSVPESAPLDTVLWEMAQYKYGCALVTDAIGRPLGIFTAIDAMRLLASMFNEDTVDIDLKSCLWP